jgi:hypothetical protein
MELSNTKARESKLDGTYLAPVYPEAPLFRDPIDDLQRIGVKKSEYRSPYDATGK